MTEISKALPFSKMPKTNPLKKTTRISINHGAGAQGAVFTESTGRPNTPFYVASRKVTTTTSDPMGGNSHVHSHKTSFGLTKKGRKVRNVTAATGAGGAYAGMVYHDRKKSAVTKSFDANTEIFKARYDRSDSYKTHVYNRDLTGKTPQAKLNRKVTRQHGLKGWAKGSAHGTALGAGAGAAAGLLSRGRISPAGGALTGGAVGLATGAQVGATRGRRSAMSDPRYKKMTAKNTFEKSFQSNTEVFKAFSAALVDHAPLAIATGGGSLYGYKKLKRNQSAARRPRTTTPGVPAVAKAFGTTDQKKKFAGGALVATGAALGFKGAAKFDRGVKLAGRAKGMHSSWGAVQRESGHRAMTQGARVFGTGLGAGLAGGQLNRSGNKNKGIAR